MTSNVKTLALVSLLSSAATLGAYKILDFDKKEVVFNESAPSAFTRMVSGSSPAVAGAPGEFTYAAEKTTPAVVHIKTTLTRAVRQQIEDPFEGFFGFGDAFGGRRRPQKQEASGSGVIISSDGYIVTNNHVVQDADEVTVILNDKRELKAKVIGTDPNSDLAVVQVKASGLPFLNFGSSDDIRVGEWVLAVGNPFNLESTVTAGIVSAKGRSINIIGSDNSGNVDAPIESFIQTDAAVNPGNSGGALVNLKGELIGINTAIASNTGQFAGYSFAVPVSIVKKVTGDLLKYGNVQRGFLGIQPKPVDGKVAAELDLKVNAGVYVGGFTENSSAKAAGLKVGDVIVKIDGITIGAYSQLTESLGRHKPGENVVVTVNRDGVEKDFNVVLKNRDGNTALLKNEPSSSVKIEALGAKFGNLSDADKARFKVQSGIKVLEVDPEGRLAYNGIEKGFVITKIDNQPISSVKQAAELLENRKGKIRIEGTDPQEPGSRYILVI